MSSRACLALPWLKPPEKMRTPVEGRTQRELEVGGHRRRAYRRAIGPVDVERRRFGMRLGQRQGLHPHFGELTLAIDSATDNAEDNVKDSADLSRDVPRTRAAATALPQRACPCIQAVSASNSSPTHCTLLTHQAGCGARRRTGSVGRARRCAGRVGLAGLSLAHDLFMRTASITPTPALQLQLLGMPRVLVGGRELRLPDRRCVALLAVVASDGSVPRERIATLLWDAESDTDARRNLRRELHRMRDAGLDGVLDSSSSTLALRPEVELDIAAFQRACANDNAPAALTLYATGLLPGFELNAAPAFNDWLAARREALAQVWRGQADAHARALQERGDLRGALGVAQALIAQDQLQEGHYRRAMTLHALLGEREAALEAYERCRRALGRELGLRPLAATSELAEQIRSGRGDAPPATEPAASRSATLAVALPELSTPVGRENLLTELERCLAAAHLTVIEGVAGVGKSTLLRTLCARGSGRTLHEARVSDARVPFAALVRWLRAGFGALQATPASWPTWVGAELARLLPELGPAPQPITGDAQRMRFYEALRVAWQSCFAASESHLFDDWQFVDDASAQWWAWWQGQNDTARLLVAARPGESRSEAAAALAAAMREASAANAVGVSGVIVVPALDEAGMLTLVQRLSGVARPERFALRLGRATGGNPFFAIETLRHLFELGLIHVDTQGQWTTPFDADTADYRELPIPPSVQAAITRRFEVLDEPTRRLLEAASLTGDDFRLELISGATALGEWEAVAALEAALKACIVRRHTETSGLYRFEHDLFAQVIAAGLSPERAALMHRALGSKLAQGVADPARIAEHFERGGDITSAQRHRLLALEAARRRYAVSDMIEQSQRLLALAPPTAAALAAHLAAAEAWRMRADAPRARAALACATGLLREDDAPALHVQLLLATAEDALREGHPETAFESITARLADTALRAHDRGRLLQARGEALRMLGRSADALADLHRAIDAFGDEPSFERGDLFNSLSRAALTNSQPAAALSHAGQAAAVMRAVDHPLGLGRALVMTGVAHMLGGQMTQAAAPLEEARRIAARHGLFALERGAILNLVTVLLAQSRTAEALALLDEGAALSTLFSAKTEEHAFLEARYQCRVVIGDLGDAFDLRPQLVELSLAVGEQYRMLSGLLVTTDLPLLIGDAAAAAVVLAPVQKVMLAEACVDSLVLRAHYALSWLALERGDAAAAEASLAAIGTTPAHSDEDRVYLAAVRHHCAALGHRLVLDPVTAAMRGNASPDNWACLLARSIAAQAASGSVDVATRTAAESELGNGGMPPLSALQLIDALIAAGIGDAWHAEGQRLYIALGNSLSRHAPERALFEARFQRLS